MSTVFDPVRLARQSGITSPASPLILPPLSYTGKSTLAGLGDIWDVEDTLEDTKAWAEKWWGRIGNISGWLPFHSGAKEAEVIVPFQNDLIAKLDTITAQVVVGANPSLTDLLLMVRRIREWASYFIKFVSDPIFVDGRASAQALNTVMPYIDGSCDYLVHNLVPHAWNCIEWGDGTIGGVGTNGMLGALSRAITAKGGSVDTSLIDPGMLPTPYVLTSGFSTPLAVGLGIVVLYMFSRRRG